MSTKLGLSRRAVALQSFSEEWRVQFAEEKAQLSAAIGPYVLDIQHIGSTSIPDLPAKPIIDIGVAVATVAEGQRCIEPLAGLGYQYMGEMGVPGRLYFVKGSEGARTHHLHINEIHSADWRQTIAFRDHLRQHPEQVQAYASIKQQLARQYPNERRIYTNTKAGFITQVLRKLLPDLWPNVGDPVTVQVYKSDLRLYRSWPVTVEAIEEDRIVTIVPIGTVIVDHLKGNWATTTAIRRYFWFNRPYHLLESYTPDGKLAELYVDIACPVSVKQWELVFFDYDLDVVKLSGKAPKIVDEDEFADAAQRLGYSSEFQAYCYGAAQEALTLLDGWQAKGCPF